MRLTVEIFIVILCIKWIIEDIVVFNIVGKRSDYRMWNVGNLATAIPCLPPFSSIVQNLRKGNQQKSTTFFGIGNSKFFLPQDIRHEPPSILYHYWQFWDM